MPISIVCPACSAKISAADKTAGKRVKCPKCGAAIDVPTPAPDWAHKPVTEQKPAAISGERAPVTRDWRKADDGNDDLPSQQRKSTEASGGAFAHSLGIGSMVLGVVALVLSLIPCVGWIGLPLSGIGLLLGAAGTVAAFFRGGHGIGFPIAGTTICGLALVIGGFWLFLLAGASKAVDDAAKRIKAADAAKAANATDQSGDNDGSSSAKDQTAASPAINLPLIGTWRTADGLGEMVFKADGHYEIVTEGKVERLYWRVRDANHVEVSKNREQRENDSAVVLEYKISDADEITIRFKDDTKHLMHRVKTQAEIDRQAKKERLEAEKLKIAAEQVRLEEEKKAREKLETQQAEQKIRDDKAAVERKVQEEKEAAIAAEVRKKEEERKKDLETHGRPYYPLPTTLYEEKNAAEWFQYTKDAKKYSQVELGLKALEALKEEGEPFLLTLLEGASTSKEYNLYLRSLKSEYIHFNDLPRLVPYLDKKQSTANRLFVLRLLSEKAASKPLLAQIDFRVSDLQSDPEHKAEVKQLLDAIGEAK